METIAPQEAKLRHDRTGNALLIDVRTTREFEAVHACDAHNLPLDRLDPTHVTTLCNGDKNRPLLILCQGGTRAKAAAKQLDAAGFTGVCCVEGGTNAWVGAGLPVVRGRSCISVERQMHIVAGTIILTGVVLALTVNPWLVLISGGVGCGLIFHGLTDLCPMGMLLAAMPWNQGGSTCCGDGFCAAKPVGEADHAP